MRNSGFGLGLVLLLLLGSIQGALAISSIGAGDKLPILNMIDIKGHKVDLEEVIRDKTALVVVWELPLNMVRHDYYQEIMEQIRNIKERSPQLTIVSIYKPWSDKVILAEELNVIKHTLKVTGVNIPVLIDQGHVYSAKLGEFIGPVALLVDNRRIISCAWEGYSDIMPQVMARKLRDMHDREVMTNVAQKQ